MDSGGAGSPFADSHRTTGGVPRIPPLEVYKTTEETLLRCFGPPVGCLPASIAVTPGDGLPGRGGSPLFASHPTTGGSADLGKGSVQNGGGHSPPSFCTLRGPLRTVHRLLARRWTSRERCPSPRVSAPGAEGGEDPRGNTVQNRGEDSSPLFCTVCKLVGRSIAVEAPLSCRCTASTA